MKKFQVSRIKKTKYKRWYPSLHWMYAGYKGLDKGLYISWFDIMLVIIRPISERE